MSLTDAFVFEPFSVNQPLIDSLLLEPDSFEVYVAIGSGGGSGTISDPYLVNTASLLPTELVAGGSRNAASASSVQV